MSVDKRRLAAAQRTAVGTNPTRAKRLGAWIIIVPALSLFSFSIVASAAGFQSKPDVASAAAKVVPQGHGDGKPTGKSDDKPKNEDNGGLVVVESSHGDDSGIAGLLGKAGKQICWISKSQLIRVSAVYRTSTTTLRVGHTTYNVVTVSGANERDLRQLLGTSAVQCRLIRVSHLFFLPFDPNMS